jgi:hypothetical protein
MEGARPSQRKTIRTMKIRIMLLLAAMLAALSAADFEYGLRPPSSVFDPNGFLELQTVKEISEPLAQIFKNEGIDVIVIVLPDIGDAPPAHVAGRFAAEWCTSPIHAVVLHVPNHKDGPWIVPLGKLIEGIEPAKLSQSVAEAVRRAASEPSDTAKVRAAATEAADMLRFWTGTAINRRQFLETARTRIRLEQENKARQWRIAMLTAAASIIPILCGITALIHFLRKPGPRFFPETNPPRRLGAPHAGGNHAVADLGPPFS